MPTPNLSMAYMGANPGEPDTVHNAALDAIDRNMAGMLTINLASDSDYTLSTATNPQQWQYAAINMTDTGVLLTTTRAVIVPTNKKPYIFINATAQTLTVKTSAGTGVDVPATKIAYLYCDGTNVVNVASGAGGGGAADSVAELTGTEIATSVGTILYKTITANTTFTEALSSAESVTLRLEDANLYTVTFPTITWWGGEPDYTGNDLFTLWKEGSTLYGVQANRQAQGQFNLLFNSAFTLIGAGGGIGTKADGTYTGDMFIVQAETANSGNAVTTRQQAQDSGQNFNLRVANPDATAKQVGFTAVIEDLYSNIGLQLPVTLTFKASSSDGSAVNYAIVEWTGTANAFNRAIVSTWAATPTLKTNFNILAQGAFTPSAAGAWGTVEAITATSGASMTNLLVFVWSASNIAQNAYIEATNFMLNLGKSANKYVPAALHEDFYNCARYFWSGQISAGAANNASGVIYESGPLYSRLRTTPTVTLGSGTTSNVSSGPTITAPNRDYVQMSYTQNGSGGSSHVLSQNYTLDCLLGV